MVDLAGGQQQMKRRAALETVVFGVALGVIAGHIALWLGLGVAIGMAIGSTLRRATCVHCEAAKRNQQLGAGS